VLGIGGVVQAQEGEVVEQWALGVINFSSSPAVTAGNVQNLLGIPNSTCQTQEELGYNFDPLSWRPVEENGGEEWIELKFPFPVFPTAIEIFESLNPGAVASIAILDENDQWNETWSGDDNTSTCGEVLRIEFGKSSFATNLVRITLDTRRSPGWNQIDAVKLIGVRSDNFQPLFEEVNREDAGLPFETIASYAFSDYDNDGWPDLLAPQLIPLPHIIKLLHNEGNATLKNRASTLPIQTVSGHNAGILFIDYDNDGDQDIFIPHGSVARGIADQDMLLRNDRGTFIDISSNAGFTDSLVSSSAISFDYNRDGFLDLYVGHADIPGVNDKSNYLYRNNGNDTFTNVTATVGLDIDFHETDKEALFGHSPGTASGGIGADFNADGWQDLYLPVAGGENRLFLNDGSGNFIDATTNDIAEPGFSTLAAIGDIDNDGDIDIYQAVQGGNTEGIAEGARRNRVVALMNLGAGEFLDITEGVGLKLPDDVEGVFHSRLVDFDNDGDVDLFTSLPSLLYLNSGNGLFIESTSALNLPGLYSVGDYDNDGYLDGWYDNRLFRNNGSGNHHLCIDLVGVESNRDGIGTQIIAHAGNWQQAQVHISGNGWVQSEQLIHFGLSDHTSVDQLEIRWPSGQVDILTDIPADQEIRIVEGRNEWYPTTRSIWTIEPPATLTYGHEVHFIAEAKPSLFEPTATITSVVADLSSLGGPEAFPLEDLGDGTYRLEHTFTVGGESDLRDVEVFVLQETSLGEHWINLSRNIDVEGDPNTAVLEDYSDALPTAFTLHQNHPNPFNSGTVIRFALPTSSDVELVIYNLAGQKVATLVQGLRLAGDYAINWDGRSEDGGVLASGIYFYQLRAGEHQETRKLLLLR